MLPVSVETMEEKKWKITVLYNFTAARNIWQLELSKRQLSNFRMQ